MSHTPGPWAYDQETDNSTDFWVFQSDGPVRVAVECSEADARLIAAAPDLLAALQAIVCHEQGIQQYRLEQARAAIARATEY